MIQQHGSRITQFVTIRVVTGLLVWLLISSAQVHAQTQAGMNTQARAEFERADAELNKTYEALLNKASRCREQGNAEAKPASMARVSRC